MVRWRPREADVSASTPPNNTPDPLDRLWGPTTDADRVSGQIRTIRAYRRLAATHGDAWPEVCPSARRALDHIVFDPEPSVRRTVRP